MDNFVFSSVFKFNLANMTCQLVELGSFNLIFTFSLFFYNFPISTSWNVICQICKIEATKSRLGLGCQMSSLRYILNIMQGPLKCLDLDQFSLNYRCNLNPPCKDS